MIVFKRTEHGFSLIEMVAALFIAGIITLFSAQGFSDYFQHRKQRLLMQQLYHDLKWARVEAIVLNMPVAIQPNKEWCAGWTIFKNNDDKGLLSASQLLKVRDGMKNCNITFSGSLGFSYFQFLPEGTSNYQNGHFYFYDHEKVTMQIIINQTGRVRWVS